jgi:hypothetical protein
MKTNTATIEESRFIPTEPKGATCQNCGETANLHIGVALTCPEPEIDETTKRIAALAKFLECDVDDISEASYGDNNFDAEGGEYMVLTDDEADDRAKEYIKDSLWAFNASFLSDFTGLPIVVFEALQPQCESANDAIEQIIEQGDGLDDFVEQAISADGRGHFMSSYDGEENEEGEYFIYRTN